MEKGTHGYLDQKRRSATMKIVINLILMAIVFFTGLLLTKTRSNYFTVAAVLMAIPLAYFVTGLFSGVYLTDDWNDFLTRVKADLEAERNLAKNDPIAYQKQFNELEKQKERLLIYSV